MLFTGDQAFDLLLKILLSLRLPLLILSLLQIRLLQLTWPFGFESRIKTDLLPSDPIGLR